MRKIRYIIFLKDVLWLSLVSFGGPQVHLKLFIDLFVSKRGYLTEEELLELNALCQILPGPTSTQTITALGFKVGGPNLAYLTLLVWVTPATIVMTFAALGIDYLQDMNKSLSFTRFIAPMAVAFLSHAGFEIGKKVIHTSTGVFLMAISALASFVFRSPWVCPIVLVIAGSLTAFNYTDLERQSQKESFNIAWSNLFLFVGVFLFSVILGAFTNGVPVRLFENFYRNGSLVFGGGQVLAPILYTEFVQFKQTLSRQEFLSGLALAQTIPGPVFSISSYIGVLSMREYGFWGKILGSVTATAGIFMPGTFLIYFVYRFWSQLKQYRIVRASLDGINAASIGLTLSAALAMLIPLISEPFSLLTIVVTWLLLQFTKTPSYLIVLGGLTLGILLQL